MPKKGNPSLPYQVKQRYDSLLHIGESKHAAKAAGTAAQWIYSWNTYHTYLKHACFFCEMVQGGLWMQNLDSRKTIRTCMDTSADRQRPVSLHDKNGGLRSG